MTTQLENLLSFAAETAYMAGKQSLAYFQADPPTEYKADDTPVTAADRAVEQVIRRQIAQTFPEHAILGEEYGEQGSDKASHRWLIDPIDGTKSFVCGIPLYALLMALEIDGQVTLGILNLPALDQMLVAARGLGCHLNGRQVRCSQQKDLSRAYIAHADTGSFEAFGAKTQWKALVDASYYRLGASDAYGYYLVACGRADVMLDPIVSIWDVAPLPVILSEAGGYFGDWQGNQTHKVQRAMAANQALAPQVLKLLGGACSPQSSDSGSAP